MMEDNTTERMRLLVRRQELHDRLAAIEADYKSGLDADSEERALQLENADVLEGIGKAAADELAQIEERLQKLN